MYEQNIKQKRVLEVHSKTSGIWKYIKNTGFLATLLLLAVTATLLIGSAAANGGSRQNSIVKVTEDTHSNLNIRIKNIESSAGQLIVFIYQYGNQFPMNPYKFIFVSKDQVSNGELVYSISNLVSGNYAVACIDDVNGNNTMDFSWGVPQEGYAFSNSSKRVGLRSIPTYKKCLFPLTESEQSISLSILY